MRSTKLFISLSLLLLLQVTSNAQNYISRQISTKIAANEKFTEVNLFGAKPLTDLPATYSDPKPGDIFLQPDADATRQMLEAKTAQGILLNIPTDTGMFVLQLFEHSIFPEGTSEITFAGDDNKEILPVNKFGKQFIGIVKGFTGSMVTLSITESHIHAEIFLSGKQNFFIEPVDSSDIYLLQSKSGETSLATTPSPDQLAVPEDNTLGPITINIYADPIRLPRFPNPMIANYTNSFLVPYFSSIQAKYLNDLNINLVLGIQITWVNDYPKPSYFPILLSKLNQDCYRNHLDVQGAYVNLHLVDADKIPPVTTGQSLVLAIGRELSLCCGCEATAIVFANPFLPTNAEYQIVQKILPVHEIAHVLGIIGHTNDCAWDLNGIRTALDNAVGRKRYSCPGNPVLNPHAPNSIMNPEYSSLEDDNLAWNNGFGVYPREKIRRFVSYSGCVGAHTLSCGKIGEVHANSITQTSATLAWTDYFNTNNYWVRLAPDNASSSNDYWQEYDVTTTSLDLTGLTSNTTYVAQVFNKCDGNITTPVFFRFTTLPSATSGTCPRTRQAVADVVGSRSVTLHWTPVDNPNVVKYYVKVEDYPNHNIVQEGFTYGTSYTFTGLQPNTMYDIKVVSICTVNRSDYTKITLTTAPPCAPVTALAASNITSNQASISWIKNPAATSQEIWYQRAGSGPWAVVSQPISANSYTLTGLTYGSSYNLKIETGCAGDNHCATPPVINFSTPQLCNPPSGLAFNEVTFTSVDLAWYAPASGASVTGYRVFYKRSNQTLWDSVSISNTVNYTLYPLLSGTAYQVKVKTICNADCALATSNVISFSTPACVIPSGLTTITGTITSAICKIKWRKAAGAGSYTVQIRPTGSAIWSNTYNTADTTYIFLGLSANRSYQVQVRSNCSNVFSSAYCPMISFSTFMASDEPDVPMAGHISESENIKGIKVYPNPINKGMLNIEVSDLSETSVISIKNAEGVTVKQIHGQPNHKPIQLDVSGFSAGMYYLQITTKGKTTTTKFTKL